MQRNACTRTRCCYLTATKVVPSLYSKPVLQDSFPQPLTDRGKGSYWTVNDNVDPRTGVHRIRKKKTKGSKARTSEEPDADYKPPEGVYAETQPQFMTTPPIQTRVANNLHSNPLPTYP